MKTTNTKKLSPEEVKKLVPTGTGMYDELLVRAKNLKEGEGVQYTPSTADSSKKTRNRVSTAMHEAGVRAPPGFRFRRYPVEDGKGSIVIQLVRRPKH